MHSLFVDDIDFSSYLNHHFTLKKDDFKNTQIEYLSNQVKTGKFTLNLYYVVGDFLNHDPRNENFGILFLEIVNNSFMIYLIYVEVFVKVLCNNANILTDLLLDNYFLEKNSNSRCQKNKKKNFIFSDELLHRNRC